MCKLFGLTSNNNLVDFKKFRESLDSQKKGGFENSYYFDSKIGFGIKHDISEDYIPYIYDNMVIIFDGLITNKKELKDDLINKGYSILTNLDSELVLKGFSYYKEKIFDKINGSYAFAIYYDSKVILVRDRLGVMPLYYSTYKKDLIFSSEIKGIINYTGYKDVLIEEMIGMLPSLSVGKTPYKDIFELPRACYLTFDGNINITEYWKLVAKKYELSFEESKEKIKELLNDSIDSYSTGDCAVLLSGGLDSSIIASYLQNKMTYSVDYEYNDIEYVIDEFNKSKDNDYIKYVLDKYNLDNKKITIKIDDLINSLKDCVLLRDYPAMADIDSSLLCLSKLIDSKVCLSGECADEIFGGYPWFFKEYEIFPWLNNIELKETLINDDYSFDIKEYITNEYNKAISKVSYLPEDDLIMKNKRKTMILNLDYFMQNLLHRGNLLTNDVDLRVPYADYRIVELLYNMPFEYMNYIKEKGLLREAYKDIIPSEIYNRTKSPYPKTHSCEYKNKMIENINNIVNEDSILNKIFKKEEIIKLYDIDDNYPWYGQLMKIPQLLAFMYQIDYWFNEYNLNLCFKEE